MFKELLDRSLDKTKILDIDLNANLGIETFKNLAPIVLIIDDELPSGEKQRLIYPVLVGRSQSGFRKVIDGGGTMVEYKPVSEDSAKTVIKIRFPRSEINKYELIPDQASSKYEIENVEVLEFTMVDSSKTPTRVGMLVNNETNKKFEVLVYGNNSLRGQYIVAGWIDRNCKDPFKDLSDDTIELVEVMGLDGKSVKIKRGPKARLSSS